MGSKPNKDALVIGCQEMDLLIVIIIVIIIVVIDVIIVIIISIIIVSGDPQQYNLEKRRLSFF